MSEDRAIVSEELPPLLHPSNGTPLLWAVERPDAAAFSLNQMQAYARTAVEAAILKERAECAKLCDDRADELSPFPRGYGLRAAAAAIRSRTP